MPIFYNGAMATVKTTFLLPVRDNDDRPLDAEIVEVENRCYEAFGSFSMAGYFKGSWRMKSGQRKDDTSAVYVLAIPEEKLPELEAILRDFKAQTTQEMIYIEIQRNMELRDL